jgi:hypothetical protein
MFHGSGPLQCSQVCFVLWGYVLWKLLSTLFLVVHYRENVKRGGIAQSVQLRTGRPGFDSRQRWGMFLFATASKPARGPVSYPMGTRRVMRPGREADHSSPTSSEVKNVWSYTFTPSNVFMAWCLVKSRNNFTFTFRQQQLLLLLSGMLPAWHSTYEPNNRHSMIWCILFRRYHW